MRTITLDIIDEKALNLLNDLEDLKLIRMHNEVIPFSKSKLERIRMLKGAMRKQKIVEIDDQLIELRSAWE